MVGLYFSGTGNSKYAVETFLREYEPGAKAYSIEEKDAMEEIKRQEEIVFGYPVQYSSLPKFLYDFVQQNAELWSGKKFFIIATMGLFCGDGAECQGKSKMCSSLYETWRSATGRSWFF